MRKYSSTVRIYSKAIPADANDPAVVIVLRKISEGRRIEAQEKLGVLIDGQVAAEAYLEKTRENVGFNEEMSKDDCIAHFNTLGDLDKGQLDNAAKGWREAVRAVDHAYFMLGLVKVENLELDEDATPSSEKIFLDGPRDLYLEIIQEVKRQFGLLPEESENFGSLSTSGEAGDGKATGTTATAADGKVITPIATADSTTLS